jgi:hypothetical protein
MVEFDMGEVVNLRVVRKRGKRQQAVKRAAEARLVHGLPKVKRALSTAKRAKADRDLDQHQIEEGEGQ